MPGEGGRALVDKLAKLTGWPVADVESKTFPDGEEYVRVQTPLRGESVVVVETGFPPGRLWRLLLLLQAARENGVADARAVVPYMPYARQDRRFLEGEPVSARVAADAIGLYANECLTVELHKDAVKDLFRVPCRNLEAVGPFAAEFGARGVEVVLAPDAGARARAAAVARRMGAAVDHLEKKRISSELVEMKPKTLDVQGKSVAILDDIISTGVTMATAVEQLTNQGASRVLCAGVHGLFIGDAVKRLRDAGAHEVLVTDTIPSVHSRVSVAEIVGRALMAPARARLA